MGPQPMGQWLESTVNVCTRLGVFFLMFIYSVFIVAFEIFSCSMWDLVPQPGIQPRARPLHWEHEVLAPGKSLRLVLKMLGLAWLSNAAGTIIQ